MRTIICFLLLLPAIAFAKKTDIFFKLTDAAGKQINGDASGKGFEKQLGVFTVTSGGKNNTQLAFSMPITGASAELKRSMANGEVLLNGLLTVTKADPGMGRPAMVYTIKKEGIRVNACSEAIGCNNVQLSNVTITATRIGWTYYQTSPNGAQTVSRKYGYDSDSGKEWTNF